MREKQVYSHYTVVSAKTDSPFLTMLVIDYEHFYFILFFSLFFFLYVYYTPFSRLAKSKGWLAD